MSLNKAIKYKKEHRKEYTGAKSVDTMCRNHKGCKWCEDNRTYQSSKELQKTNEQLKDITKLKEKYETITKILEYLKDNEILRGEDNDKIN